MSAPRWYPVPAEISREALIVLFGAVVAGLILSQWPALKKWITDRLPPPSVPGF